MWPVQPATGTGAATRQAGILAAMAQLRRSPRGAQARALTVVERLAAEYPVAECALVHDGPLQLLVATILSAQCTDERVNMVTPALFLRWPNAAALAAADHGELEDAIRSTGFFRAKARAIIEMSRDLVEHFQGQVPDTMEALVTLRGVGRKTANVVLGVGFGMPGFAVDTHVTRLTGRLNLTSSTAPVEIEKDVCSLVPASEWTALSLRLILHGRRVCLARRPRCPACVLNDICPSAQLPGLVAPAARRRRVAPARRGPSGAR